MSALRGTKADRAAVEAAIRSPDPWYKPDLVVRIAGRESDDAWKGGNVSHNADGTISLDASLSGYWEDAVRGAPVEVDVYLAELPIRLFTGRLHWPKAEVTQTEVVAHTPGVLAARWPFGGAEGVAYPRWPAAQVMRDAAMRLPYDRREITVPNAPEPRVDLFYEPETAIANAFNDAGTAGNYVHTDTVRKGFLTIPKPSLAAPGTAVWHYDVSQSVLRKGFQRTAPEEEWDGVVVYRHANNRSGPSSSIYEYPPVRVPVPRRRRRGLPNDIPGLDKWVPLEDAHVQAGKNAGSLAREIAAQMGREEHGVSIKVPFNPLLKRYDLITVDQGYRTADELVERRWLVILDGVLKHSLYASLQTEMTGVGMILSEKRTRLSRRFLRPRSPQVLTIPVVVNDEQLLISREAGSWVEVDERGQLYLIPSRSGGRVTTDASGQLFVGVS